MNSAWRPCSPSVEWMVNWSLNFLLFLLFRSSQRMKNVFYLWDWLTVVIPTTTFIRLVWTNECSDMKACVCRSLCLTDAWCETTKARRNTGDEGGSVFMKCMNVICRIVCTERSLHVYRLSCSIWLFVTCGHSAPASSLRSASLIFQFSLHSLGLATN